MDSIRGLAAFSVVIGHFQGALSDKPLPWYQQAIPPGHAAVILFFTLSGYVLAIPFWQEKQGSYLQYLVRRFFRIYVPYAAAVCVALLGAFYLSGAIRPLSSWFYLTWHTPITGRLIAAQFLTMSTSPAINTAFWSLRYEVEMSILFPLLVLIIEALRGWGTLSLAVLMVLSGQTIVHFHPQAGPVQELGITLLWSSCFVLGALASWQNHSLGAFFSRIPVTGKLALAVITYLGYIARPNVVIIPAALLLILFTEHTRLHRWLSVSWAEYLGRISYSLYLTHGTVLFALLILLYPRLSPWPLFVLYLVLALIVAHLFCILVEEPSMWAGKAIVRRWRTPPSVRN